MSDRKRSLLDFGRRGMSEFSRVEFDPLPVGAAAAAAWGSGFAVTR